MPKFKKNDAVTYHCSHSDSLKHSCVQAMEGQVAIVTCVYEPGVKHVDSLGSEHTLPKDSEFIYDIFFKDQKLQWVPAKECELKKYVPASALPPPTKAPVQKKKRKPSVKKQPKV